MPLRILSLSLFTGNIRCLLSKKKLHYRSKKSSGGAILIMLDFLTTRNEMNFVSHIEGFMRLWDLCINIDTNTGFQFDGDMVIPDGDLLDPASHQCFIEFCKEGGLLRNVILQVVNSFYLFISCSSIDGCFLAKFSEPEDLIRYFVVVLFAVGFLNQFLLQRHQLFVNAVNGCCL